MCERIGVVTGDRVDLSLRLASDELPDELATLLEDSRARQSCLGEADSGAAADAS
jgi:hypothetical protein